MRRILELISDVRARYPDDNFFSGFEESCRISPDKRRYYRTYDDALRELDGRSWGVLKSKALAHFLDHREGQLKQGFFNQLNEAFAYRYLKNQKYLSISIIEESGTRTPDISYRATPKTKFCEVKTIGLSDKEIEKRRTGHAYDGRIYEQLSPQFFCKFQGAIDKANEQLEAAGSGGLIFMILVNDDLALDHYSEYREQIRSYCLENEIFNLYIKMGLRGRRRIRLTRR